MSRQSNCTLHFLLSRGFFETSAEAMRKIGTSLVDARWMPQHPNRPMPPVRESRDRQLRSFPEVKINTQQALCFVRYPNDSRRKINVEHQVSTLIVPRHIEHDHTVHQSACRNPLQSPCCLILGEQQDVIIESPRCLGNGENECHVCGRVRIGPKGSAQREDMSRCACQHPRTGIGAVAELSYSFRDPLARLFPNRTLAAQRIRHGADRHPCRLRDIMNVGHVPPLLIPQDRVVEIQIKSLGLLISGSRATSSLPQRYCQRAPPNLTRRQ